MSARYYQVAARRHGKTVRSKIVPVMVSVPGFVYGPTNGVQSVKDNVGPDAVSDPGGGVAFSSASDIQALIDANPFDTIFVASATGTFANFRGINYGTKHPRFYFPGAASSYSIEGSGSGNQIGLDGSTGLEVNGGTWKLYGNSASASFMAPINAKGASTFRDAVFTLNGQKGLGLLATAADAFTVSRCSFISNGRYGLAGTRDTDVTQLYTPIIEFCIFDNNNTNRIDTGGDAGGQKFGYTNGGIWRNNWYKNNKSFACWLDGYNRDALIHDNVCENNLQAGIFFEISRGGSIIEHNYSKDDGKGDATDPVNSPFNNAGILVSCSPCDATGATEPGPNVASEIRFNDIDCTGNVNPIALIDHNVHPVSEQTRKWRVHNNRDFNRGTGRFGLFDPHNEDLITLAAADNTISINEHHVTTVGAANYDADGANTFAQFQAAGYDVAGTEVAI